MYAHIVKLLDNDEFILKLGNRRNSEDSKRRE